MRRDPEWLIAHVRDPQMIAPGLREPPRGGMSDGQARSIASYVKKLRAGVAVPAVDGDTHVASLVIGRYCANCHMIDGEGGSIGPDLTRIGAQRDAKWLHVWITQPDAVDPVANMPAFGEALSEKEMSVNVKYLADRK